MKNYNKIDAFYIQDDEEFLIKSILSGYYIEQNLDMGMEVDYALRFLQNELNELLHSFINGGFSYKGYMFFPIMKDVSKNNVKKIKRLKKIVIFLDNNGYDFSNSIAAYENNAKNSKGFAIILSSLYQDFAYIKNKNTKSINKRECQQLDLSTYKKSDLDYLKPLNELKDYANEYLNRDLAGFYLHGSLATKDYVKGWSDVDTLAIVSKETLKTHKKLLDLRDKMYLMRHFFYKIDPLQHHGSIIISEYDLENYCKAYFPIEIFKYAKSFFKEDRIRKLKIRNHSEEALARLFWFVNYFRILKIEKKYSIGSYDAKNLLHCITLFPAIYLNAKDIFIYKKFSFDIARKDFKKRDWKVIDEVSNIRKNWKGFGRMPFVNLGSKVNPLLSYQLNSKVLDLFKDVKRINNINIGYLVENMFKLSEEAWTKIKKNAGKKIQFF